MPKHPPLLPMLLTAVFTRNLSFDVENENLAELFQQFGALDYALVVRDKETGESRGTGFVKFKEKASADACLARASSQVLVRATLSEKGF